MLDELKNYLNITYKDDDVDKKISSALESAKHYINEIACEVNIDFESDLSAKQLLFDCVRYIYNNALEDFYNNFKCELTSLRLRYLVISDETEE